MKHKVSIKRLISSITLSALLVVGGGVPLNALVPETGSSPTALATTLASIGDSMSVAYGVTATGSNSIYSWTTGEDSSVFSIRQRIADRKGSAVNKYVGAKSGSTSFNILSQANAVASSGAQATTFLIGANDVCKANVSSMTSTTDYRANISAALDVLSAANVKVIMASIPDLYQLWAEGKDVPAAVQKWDDYNTCATMLSNPNSTAQVDVDRRAATDARLTAFNDILSDECGKRANCSYDGGAVHNTHLTISDVSPFDYFHPGITGQAKLAEAAWPAYKAFYPNVFASGSGSDTTAPAASITSPTSGAVVNNSATLVATASDNIGVTSLKFYSGATLIGNASLSSGAWTYTYNTTSLPNGTYPVVAKAYDAAGNIGTSSSINLVVNHSSADTTAPVATITSPASGSTVAGTVTLQATATDNLGVTSVKFYSGATLIGNASLVSGVWSLSFNTNTAATPDGSYSFVAKAYDAAGNVGTSSAITATIDNTPAVSDTTAPTVAITSPANGATVNGLVTLCATATDDVAVNSVKYYSGTTLIGSAVLSSGEWILSYNTASLANGTYSITAKAYDAANNVGTSTPITLYVNQVSLDTTAPTVSIISPTGGSTVSGTVELKASASDANGVSSVRFYSGTDLIGYASLVSGYWTLSFNTNTSDTPNGTYSFNAKAYDAAGNIGTSSSISATITNGADTTAPTASITSPASGATVVGGVVLEALATDAVGVTSVEFFVDSTSVGTGTLGSENKWAKVIDSSALSEGSHSVYAVVKDAALNTTTTSTVSFTVANTCTEAPVFGSTIWLVSPCEQSVLSGTIQLRAENSGTIGSARFYSKPNNSSTTYLLGSATYDSVNAVWVYSYDTNQTANGGYEVTIRTYDTSGTLIEISTPKSITVHNIQ